jgi:hypothetical protein
VKGVPSRHIRRHADRDAGVKFTPLAGSRHPFKAALAVLAQFEAAMKIEEPSHRAFALSAISPPRSRGHGGRHRVMQRQVLGRSMRDRSCYKPRIEDRKHERSRIFGSMTAALIGG